MILSVEIETNMVAGSVFISEGKSLSNQNHKTTFRSPVLFVRGIKHQVSQLSFLTVSRLFWK